MPGKPLPDDVEFVRLLFAHATRFLDAIGPPLSRKKLAEFEVRRDAEDPEPDAARAARIKALTAGTLEEMALALSLIPDLLFDYMADAELARLQESHEAARLRIRAQAAEPPAVFATARLAGSAEEFPENLVIAVDRLRRELRDKLAELTRSKALDKPQPRLVVCRQPPSVTLDGVAYGVTEEQAAFVDILARNFGHRVGAADFEADPILKDVGRRDRLKKNLPLQIRQLIDSGGGSQPYKLTLPPLA